MPFTPNSALDLLFPEELIPQHIKDQLPPELHVRLTALGIFISFPFRFLYPYLTP
jgi:hypothetical protein